MRLTVNFPVAHSITQRASFATVAALNGARDFHFGGMLGIDKVFSAEQLVIDTEIVKYVRKIVEGVPFDDEKLGFDMICEVGPGGDYLPHPSTVENFRGLWGSRFFENVSPEQWAASGRKGPSEKVREYLAELREGYDYVLDPDKQREIDEIYEAAVKELT